LGHIGGALNFTNLGLGSDTFTSGLYGNLNAVHLATDNIRAQYIASVDNNLVDGLYTAMAAQQDAQTAWKQYLQSLAESTTIAMVNDDVPLASQDLISALTILISQISGASASFQRPTVSTSISAFSVNHGNGVLVASLLDPVNGLQRDNVFAEVLTVTCSNDSQQSSAVLNAEPFAVAGVLPQSDPLSFLWPAGSGASQTVNAVDATTQANNFLANGGLSSFSPANTPVNWTIVTGSAGTTILQSSVGNGFLSGVACLEMASDGSTLICIKQQVSLLPETTYAINAFVKVDASASAGTLVIQLVDGSSSTGAVINDQAGNANSISIAHGSITTSYQALNGYFRTPRVLPSTGVFLEIQQSVAFTSGKNVYVANVALAEPTELYQGGPFAAIFSGNTPFIIGDGWNLTVANNYGGAFCLLFERLFAMRENGLILPTSGSPTISDSLVG